MVKEVAIERSEESRSLMKSDVFYYVLFFFYYVPFDLEGWVYIPFPFQFKVSVY